MKGKKKVVEETEGTGVEEKVWKVVGEKKVEEKLHKATVGEKDNSKAKREFILERNRNKTNSRPQDKVEVFFIDPNGVILSKNQFILNDNPMDTLVNHLNNDSEMEK